MALDSVKISSYAIQDPNHPEIELAQVKHRINLIRAWNIKVGSKVLELGCGQGTCTTVLAEAVGPSGHVDALDPAPKDYGAPYTLGQAQDHITASPVGSRITWHQADPIEFLESSNNTWDVAVLAHCIWYFKSPETLKEILLKLKGRVSQIAIAEYAFQATETLALPHLLATIARATLEVHLKDSNANIQSPLSPAGITDIAGKTNIWKLEQESILIPDADLSDGYWEVGMIKHASFLEDVEKATNDGSVQQARIALLLRSLQDSVLSSVTSIGDIKQTRTMDVWAASFSSQEQS